LLEVATNKYYFDVRKYLDKKKNKVVLYPIPEPIPNKFILFPGVGLQVDGQRIATP
jgi:hypothetical protein